MSKATNPATIGLMPASSRSGGFTRVARSAIPEDRALPGMQELPQPISTPSSTVGATQQEDGPDPRSWQQHVLPGSGTAASRTVRKRMAEASRTAT